MNPHFIMIEAINRCNAWFEEIQCRHTYCLLSVINYTNGLIIATWLFGCFGLVLDLIYCSASCMFGIAITGLYLNHPILMLPDGVHKIVMTLCALFYSLHEMDIGAENAEFRLVLVIIAVFLQFAENYVLFQLLSAKHQQSDQGALSSPPPTYDQLWVVEVCQQSRSCPVTKIVMSEPVNEESRPETPPPCYELAIKALSTSQPQNRLSLNCYVVTLNHLSLESLLSCLAKDGSVIIVDRVTMIAYPYFHSESLDPSKFTSALLTTSEAAFASA